MYFMKWNQIKINPNESKWDKKINRVIHIPAELSKTGRSRDVIAPIADNIKSLIKWYSRFGIEVDEKSDNYVFCRLTDTVKNENIPTTDVAWQKRLNKVLEGATGQTPSGNGAADVLAFQNAARQSVLSATAPPVFQTNDNSVSSTQIENKYTGGDRILPVSGYGLYTQAI